jgi:hypothetical protein
MASRPVKRACLASALLGLGLAAVSFSGALARNPNEKDIKPAPNIQDTDEIYDKDGTPKKGGRLWVLDLKVKPLRSIKVNVPGRGEQICYYLWYQVINKTSEPHTFVPDFELVTHDTRMVYRDEILPSVQEAIARAEGGPLENSVTITREPIPAARANAVPRPVTGVAVWTDPNEPLAADSEATRAKKAKLPKLVDSNSFSIFIAGLSNGWAETETVGGASEKVIRRKTLQIQFRRYGDGTLRRDEDLKLVGSEWLYRASKLTIPKEEKKDAGVAPKKDAP